VPTSEQVPTPPPVEVVPEVLPEVVPQKVEAREPEPVQDEPFADTVDDPEAMTQPLLDK